MKTDRRGFLGNAAGIVAAGSLGLLGGSQAAAEEKTGPENTAVLPIIDTHQHLWDLTKFRLPWLAGGGPLAHSFVSKDYHEAIQGLNIVKSVYMEVDVDPAQHLAEAEMVVELCRRGDTPTCAAVIGGQPDQVGFLQHIRRFRNSPYVKGIRNMPKTTAVWREKRYLQSVRLLGELGMSFDLCMPPTELPAAIELVDQCPGTRFIVDHCANADPMTLQPGHEKDAARAETLRRQGDQWRRDLARLAERKNTVCKISGIVARAPQGSWTAADLAAVINHCLDSFGADRVMFGSDWPVCTTRASLRQWVEALKEVIRNRPIDDQRKLLHDNAVRVYGL